MDDGLSDLMRNVELNSAFAKFARLLVRESANLSSFDKITSGGFWQ